MKRTITGRTSSRTMTLGDLRQFVSSLEGMPDEASVTARVTFRKRLRSVTVEEDDLGFRDYIQAVGANSADRPASAEKPEAAGQTTST